MAEPGGQTQWSNAVVKHQGSNNSIPGVRFPFSLSLSPSPRLGFPFTSLSLTPGSWGSPSSCVASRSPAASRRVTARHGASRRVTARQQVSSRPAGPTGPPAPAQPTLPLPPLQKPPDPALLRSDPPSVLLPHLHFHAGADEGLDRVVGDLPHRLRRGFDTRDTKGVRYA